MKKAISILLAITTLAFATSAMADTGTANLTNGKSNGVQYNRNTNSFVASSTSTSTMPCFRPGDTVKFDVTGAAVNDDITLITYELGQVNSLSNSTLQYINQYKAEATTQNVSYVVRDLASGVYQLDIKVGSNAVKSLYYKIGNVRAAMIPANGNTDAFIIRDNGDNTWSVGFVGKVMVDNNITTLADIGAEPGFAITIGGTTKKYNFGGTDGGDSIEDLAVADTTAYHSGDKLQLDATHTSALTAGSELYGGYSFVYGMTIYNIDSSELAAAIEADAITDAE